MCMPIPEGAVHVHVHANTAISTASLCTAALGFQSISMSSHLLDSTLTLLMAGLPNKGTQWYTFLHFFYGSCQCYAAFCPFTMSQKECKLTPVQERFK